MIPLRGLVQSVKGWIGKPIAGPETDPQHFFGTLYALPNPDPILREMGQAERVYASIAADAHVLGDLRSIRGNFRSHSYRIKSGAEGDSKAQAAKVLCEQWMARTRPNRMVDWLETMWQMSAAFAHGYRAHELVWSLDGGKYLPGEVIDRPGRRIRFDVYGNPLLVTRTNMLGEPVEPYQMVISRHMPTSDNPYGVATMSSCFWPWTFKTGGWRFFVKYCERHGLPWPVGRYPQSTDPKEIDKLEQAIASMVDSGYVVAPEGTGLELLVPASSGSNLPQQSLIDLCNTEMSKALTGQAMVAELRGVGARAASETALKRQESIDDSVRDIAAQSMAEIFQWITRFNFGDGVAPPTLEFFRHENAGKERAESYQLVADMGARPSKSALLEEMGMPEAESDDDALMPAAPKQPAGPVNAQSPAPTAAKTADQVVEMTAQLANVPGYEFARAIGLTESRAMQLAAEAADQAIEDHMIEPVARMLARYEAEGKTLAEFSAALSDVVGEMDDSALREIVERSLTWSMLRGAVTRAD